MATGFVAVPRPTIPAMQPVAPNVGPGTVQATGSTNPRTLQLRFAEVYSIKDFGAVCDGATNDYASVASFVTLISTTPTTLLVPGPCVVGTNITIPSTVRVRFEGDGAFTGAGTVTYTAWTEAIFSAQAGTATPIVDGTGAAGTSALYARQDHVHPTDTSRAPVASPTFTGTATTPKLVTSAASGSDAIEIVQGSILSLNGSTATQTLRYNDGTAASIPGAEAWVAPTLLNSWVNFGAPYPTAGYFRDAAGIVHLKGLLKSGTLTSAAFVLPAGYRPTETWSFSAVSNGAFGILTVDASGNVVPATGSNVSFALDGVTFRAEQ